MTRTGRGARLWSVAVAVALVMPVSAGARPRRGRDGMTPEQAANNRTGPQQAARALVQAGDAMQAGVDLDVAAAQHGDPILYIDAGEAYLAGARAERDEELARAAIERGHIALDILYFHIDEDIDRSYRLVEGDDVPDLIDRAKRLIADAEQVIEDIEQEKAAPVEPPPTEQPRDEPDRVKILTITGASLAAAGAAVLVVGVAGLGLGAARQREAEDPAVYGEEYDAVEARGKRANLMAYVGLPLGAVLIGGGVAALLIANKKRKAGSGEPQDAGPEDTDDVAVLPWTGPGQAGLQLRGRF